MIYTWYIAKETLIFLKEIQPAPRFHATSQEYVDTRVSHSRSLKFFVLELPWFSRHAVFVYQYVGRAFLSFTLRQSRVKTQKFEIIIIVSVFVLWLETKFYLQNAFYQNHHFANSFQLGFWTYTKPLQKEIQQEALKKSYQGLTTIMIKILESHFGKMLNSLYQNWYTKFIINYDHQLINQVYETKFRYT